MPGARFIRAAACALLLFLAGCGAPDELSRKDSRTITEARERLDDAIDTEESIRTSKREAARLRREVSRIVTGGAFESPQLDEFGLAALGELQLVVPSLVVLDARGDPSALDREATSAFLRYARTDARRALVRPARRQVARIEKAIEDSGADGETKLRADGRDVSLRRFVGAAAQDLRPIWPGLARQLDDAL